MLGYLLRSDPREIYRVNISENVIVFTVRRELVDDILVKVTRKELIDSLLAIARTEEGNIVDFSVTLPFITFPNYAHKGVDWEALGKCANEVRILFWLFNLYLSDDWFESSFKLSDMPQLMAIATQYSKDRDMHACPMEVGFSEKIAQLLKEKFEKQTTVDVAINEGGSVYLKLTEKTKRSFAKEKKYLKRHYGGMSRVVAYVRDSGVPQFSVPGNCACLGANPDSFQDERDMYSHNLDSTLQQMTMLVAVVTFWNEILKPLYRENALV